MATEHHPAHHYINEAEQLARELRLASGGRLTLAVVWNTAKTGLEYDDLRDRQGMSWHEAHRAVESLRQEA